MTIIQKIKNLIPKEIKLPQGIATLAILAICVTCYFKMSPHYGDLIVPDQLANDGSVLSFFKVIWLSIIGGFYHANLSHIVRNFAFTLVPMLVVEKKMGPLHLIALYVICSAVGGLFQFHMTGGLGIGSSCVTFGLLPVAVILMTTGIARLAILPILIVMGMEAAQWWIPDGIGHLAHFGGAVAGMLYILSYLTVNKLSKDKE